MLDKYEKLKEVIQKANPEKIWVFPHQVIIGEKTRIPIRLADVLLAFNSWDYDDIAVDNYGRFCQYNDTYMAYEKLKDENDEDLIIHWNLKEDLDNQSNECKEFLINLLVK